MVLLMIYHLIGLNLDKKGRLNDTHLYKDQKCKECFFY